MGTLATASSASAALAGRPHATFTDRPNLKAVTFDGGTASFKFDVHVSPSGPLDANDFVLGGYRSSIVNSGGASGVAAIDVMNHDTVLVTYSGVDINNATFGAVNAGAVNAAGGILPNSNMHDATQITGATGQTGTRGHTAGPDLVSAAVDSTFNTITYTFDQGVDGSPAPDPDNFAFLNSDNDLFTPTSVSVSGKTVEADFGVDVDTAVIAIARREDTPRIRAVDDAESESPAPPAASVLIPGKTALTDGPVLLSTELEGAGTMLFTFAKNVSNPDEDDFWAITSNGAAFQATGAATTDNPKVIRATFGTSQFVEHIVFGSITAGAVETTGLGEVSREQGKPAGGNAGALATGYTTAPDALQATINRTAGQVTVLFDSRLDAADVDGYALYSRSGSLIVDQANTVFFDTFTNPAQTRVVVQFDTEDTDVADILRIRGQRVDIQGGLDWTNVAPGGNAASGTIPAAPFGFPIADSQFDDNNVEVLMDLTSTTTVYKKQ